MASRRGPIRWLHRLGLGTPAPDESAELEIEHHVAELTDRLIADGWNSDEARSEAERRFGDARRYRSSMARMEKRSAAAAQWAGWLWMVRNVVLSVSRTVRRYPGFAAGVVLTLGLGIGANATMYGVVDRLLLRAPEHISDPDHVVRLFLERTNPISSEPSIGSVMAYPDYADFKAHEQMSVAAYTQAIERTVGEGLSATRVRVGTATSDFFALLGVEPMMGRFYTSDEAMPGSAATAVLGAEYWRSAYGANPAILGNSIEVSGRPHTVIGVAPPDFTGVDLVRVDVWLPLELAGTADDGPACLESRGCYWLEVVGRMAAGASTESGAAEATALHLAGRRTLIDANRYSARRVVLASLIAARGPDPSQESRVARWLAGVSLIVLLIACANVANLLLARGTHREQEVAVRLSLGAPRSRVAGQVFAESACLALLGAIAALALVRWGGGIVRATLLPDVHFPGSPVTARVIVVSMAAALAAGLLAGVAPALQGARQQIGSGFRAVGRGSARKSKLRAGLTVFQAAMSMVLLVGAGLFVRSLDRLGSVDLGFEPDRVLLAQLEIRGPVSDRARDAELFDEALQRVRGMPGVQSAATTSIYFQMAYAEYLSVPGLDSIPQLPGGGPYNYPVSDGYFETLGLSIVAGRPLSRADLESESEVAVISETMATTLWPDGDALGSCITVDREAQRCVTVVGIAEDAARMGFADEAFMAYYLPHHLAADEAPRGIYVRARADADITDEVAAVLRSFSPRVRYARVASFQSILDPQARSWRLGAAMFSVFGLLALLLAAIGLYSVLSFDVAQRTRELGIRSALGAERARLLRSVLRQGMRLGVLGVLLGLATAYLAAPLVGDLLFEVSPRDPGVLTLVVVVLIGVTLAASLVPGLRATRVDPIVALKTE